MSKRLIAFGLGIALSCILSGNAVSADTVLLTAYDVRDDGRISTVKSQGKLGTCWALTAAAALEARLPADMRQELSADHLSLNNDFVIDQNEGGDYKMIMAYLSGWQGPVWEKDDPYGDGVTVDGLAPVLHVQEMQLLEGESREGFKQAVLDYGPVQTSLVMTRNMTDVDDQYYKQETAAFYDGEQRKNNHDVLILGWDDAFPKENFVVQPSADGAWICQNTWGTDFGDKGIFYVSYEDANIARGGLAYTRIEATDNYDYLYQWDDCGWQGRIGYGQSQCRMANIFTANGAEDLCAVGFYATQQDTAYTVYVVRHASDGASLENGQYLTSGTLERAGYYTVDLEEAVALDEGERFAVVVDIDSPGSRRPVAVELAKDDYTQKVSLAGKESYISSGSGKWENAQQKYSVNVCLKAYTTEREGKQHR